jgi:hypothetical protein
MGLYELHQPHIWSSTDKDASYTVSNGGLTITGGGGGSGSFVSARCTRRMAAYQKIYFECTLNAFPAGVGIGIANASAPLTSYIGSDTNGVSAFFPGPGSAGTWSYNGGQTGTLGSPAAGALICFAIFVLTGQANALIWCRVGATGQWNNDTIVNQNPALLAGGLAIPGVFSKGVMIGISSNNTSAQVTINPGPTMAGTTYVNYRFPNSMGNAQ